MLNMMDIIGGLLLWFANNKIKQNQHPLDLAVHRLAKELHKPIVKNF